MTAHSAEDALKWFEGYFSGPFVSEADQQVARSFQKPVVTRLDALLKAGLGYISTDRIVGTLSGGEFQRLQLAGLVRAPLTGVAYILDEPSFGLHPSDTRRIGDLILNLNRQGNTIILVDHSPVLLEKSDFIIELGPGAGSLGGEVIYAGKTEDGRQEDRRQEDGRQEDRRPVDGRRKRLGREGLWIEGANANNLRNIDVEIPRGGMTVITGVSGSGKTSLMDRVIYASYEAGRPISCQNITGFGNFADLVYISQSVHGKGHTATVGSMLGISESIAKFFAGSDESKSRGYKSSHFLTGSRDSRCPECEGSGQNRVSMDFFNDVNTPCERCGGTGFRDEVLEILIDGKSVYDVLQIPLADISGFIKTNPAVIDLVIKTGLGHLSGGRLLKTLSVGELQRLKLVSGLSDRVSDNTLCLLDEPTGGLHQRDIEKLSALFDEILERGNTIVCVTHEPLLMDAASKTIQLGPGGGYRGGQLVPFTV